MTIQKIFLTREQIATFKTLLRCLDETTAAYDRLPPNVQDALGELVVADYHIGLCLRRMNYTADMCWQIIASKNGD